MQLLLRIALTLTRSIKSYLGTNDLMATRLLIVISTCVAALFGFMVGLLGDRQMLLF
jgi:hypothetical protein